MKYFINFVFRRGCNSLTSKKRLNGVTKEGEKRISLSESNCPINNVKVELSFSNSGQSSTHMSSSMSRLSIESFEDLSPTSSFEKANANKNDNTNDELLDVFVSIGKHSYLCPRSRQYFASEFPNLPKKRHQDKQDLLKEIIIDEFSLLLFSSTDDYNVS